MAWIISSTVVRPRTRKKSFLSISWALFGIAFGVFITHTALTQMSGDAALWGAGLGLVFTLAPMISLFSKS